MNENTSIIPNENNTQLKQEPSSESLNAAAGGVGVKAGDVVVGVDKIDNSVTLGDGSTYNATNVKTVNKNRFDNAIGCKTADSAEKNTEMSM